MATDQWGYEWIHFLAKHMKQALYLSNFIKYAFLLLGFFLIAFGAIGETVIRGPYLQKATPTSMTFRWRTDVATVGVVRYGSSPGNLAGGAVEASAVTDHEVTVTGLTASMQYYYSVGTPTGSLLGDASTYFYTFPAEGTAKKTRIWALGDFGNNSARHTSVKNAFKNYVQNLGDPYIDLWLWLGDNAYNSGLDTEYQAYTFSTDQGYGGDRFMKQTPIFATPGNHDYADNNDLRVNLNIAYYNVVSHPTNAEAGGVASGTESYYSFTYGNIHVVSLDSDRYEDNADRTADVRFVETKPQVSWLKQDLAAAQRNTNIKWIIAFWHQPPYTKGTHDSDTEKQLRDVRMNLLPVLEQYKVDLVLCGHSHVYERSRLMKGHYGDAITFDRNTHNPADGSNAKASGKFDGSANSCYYFKSRTATVNEGTVYVVNGHGGAPGGHVTSGIAQWPHSAMEVAYDSELGGSMYLEIEGGKLVAKMIAGDGSIQDQFTIIKDADTFPVPTTNGSTLAATCECTDGTSQTHYTDNSLNKLLSIRKNGQNLGKVGDGTFSVQLKGTAGASFIAKNSPANYVGLPTGWYGANRYFTVSPTTEPAPANPVTVSFYYTQADLAAINSGVGQTLLPEQLKVFKINDVSTSFNADPASGHTTIPKALSAGANGASILAHSSVGPSVSGWTSTTLSQGVYRADFLAPHLGGGGIGGSLNGASPLGSLASLCENLFAGTGAGSANTTGCSDVALGFRALFSNQTGRNNTVVGDSAGYQNLVSGNTFIGAKAGYANITGTQLTFVGDSAGYRSTGLANTFIGYRAGMNTTTGSTNTFLGAQAGINNTTGSDNFFLGLNAGPQNTIGTDNFFLGVNAGGGNTTGNFNVYLGNNAGNGTGVNGERNVAIGVESGKGNVNGSTNTFIGFRADGQGENLTNATAIGANATVSRSNALVLGDRANVGIGTNAPTAKLEVVSGRDDTSGLKLTNLTSESPTRRSASKFLTVDAAGNVVLAGLPTAEEMPNKPAPRATVNDLSKQADGYKRLTNNVTGALPQVGNWPAYVVARFYPLEPLAEVDRYFRQYQRLPGMPSTEDVANENTENADMNARLLKKIEDLTLYVIELKKEVEALRQAAQQQKQ